MDQHSSHPGVLKILEALWGYAAEAPAALLVEQLLQAVRVTAAGS